jgi:YjjI family glycine radical enzyme
MNLKKLSDTAKDKDELVNEILPEAVNIMIDHIENRIKYIVEESNFFESSFLVREKLIDINKFTAMFGIVGLAESVNKFYDDGNLESRFGYNEKADDFGEKIIKIISDIVNSRKVNYCYGTDGYILLHGQVGIDTDENTSPGCRIPIGDEPELHDHIIQSARYHKYFPSGIGDVFSFDFTVKNNLEYLEDIIRGAFKKELRYFSLYSSDSDVVRITGYLVKRSEIEKYKNDKQVLRDTVALGYGADEKQHVLSRKLRK